MNIIQLLLSGSSTPRFREKMEGLRVRAQGLGCRGSCAVEVTFKPMFRARQSSKGARVWVRYCPHTVTVDNRATIKVLIYLL